MNLTESTQEKFLVRTSKRAFYNVLPMDMSKLGQSDIKDNLSAYIQTFSKGAREIFENFKFDEFIGLLADANLLYKVVQKFANTDLSSEVILTAAVQSVEKTWEVLVTQLEDKNL